MQEVFKGQSGRYRLTTGVPFAFGRSSLLFEALTNQEIAVALKVFRTAPPRENVKEFLNEIRAQRSLSHPNILPILDFGSTSGQTFGNSPFLVLPNCKAGNLRHSMKERYFFPLRLAMQVLLPIASAVDHAHKNGVIHGDVKPENILFGAFPSSPFLADFGVAKYFPVEETVSTVEPGVGGQPGGAGSTAYMSPEQIEDGILSTRSDIYALATVGFELLTGSLPFDVRVPPYQQMSAKIAGRLLDPRSLNHLLSMHTCNALLQALSTDRARRPDSAVGFIQALTETDGGKKVPGPAPGNVFITYSHHDEKWLKRLETVLKPLVRDHRITLWSDRKIEAGSNWRREIESAILSAQVAILLVSANFLASDFIAGNELRPLLAAASSGGVKVLWVAVSASLYRKTAIAELQAVNDPERPLDRLSASALNNELVKIAEAVLSASKGQS